MPGKSDQIDALAAARAVVKDGVEPFPVANLNEQAMEIRLRLTTARPSLPSGPAPSTGCGGICSSSAPSSSAT